MQSQFTPNTYRVEGAITYIALTNRARVTIAEALIDSDDRERVLALGRWHRHPCGTPGLYYVGTHRDGKCPLLHRVVMEVSDGIQIDHKNNDGLDCRKQNLRPCSNLQNAQNRKGAHADSLSGVRNVHWMTGSGTWGVVIRVAGKSYSFGAYQTIAEAEAVATKARAELMPFAMR